MKKIALASLTALLLTGCAQNPQQAAAMQALGAELLRDSQPVYAPLPSQTSGPRSTSCRNVGGTVICNHNY